MPSYYNFDEVVNAGLTKYSGHKVNYIDTVGNQVYRNNSDRIFNFLSKVFLNNNLKPAMKRKLFISNIKKFEQYQYLIINRPDIIDREVLKFAMDKSETKILLLWDSLEKIPTSPELISLFDVVYSFDSNDCKNYGFEKIENFHFFDDLDINEIKPSYDVVFLGTADGRIENLKKTLGYFKINNIKAKAYIYVPPNKNLKRNVDIEVFTKITPFKDSFKFALNGKVILDLGHKNQTGLSFRVFEAMAFGKKLITDNKHVKAYDFYNENNIFVIDDIDKIQIPDSFWTTPYKTLPANIIDKYHIKNWVKRILNGK